MDKEYEWSPQTQYHTGSVFNVHGIRQHQIQHPASNDIGGTNLPLNMYAQQNFEGGRSESPPLPPHSLPAAKKIRTGRPRKMSAETAVEWTDELTEHLINLWQEHEVLYKVTHPSYHIKDENSKEIQNIINKIQEDTGQLLTSSQILGKLQSLKTYFCKERGKSRTKGGKGTGNRHRI